MFWPAILATFQALLTVGSNIDYAKGVLGVNLFSANKEEEAFKARVILTKKLYQLLQMELKEGRIAHHALLNLLR